MLTQLVTMIARGAISDGYVKGVKTSSHIGPSPATPLSLSSIHTCTLLTAGGPTAHESLGTIPANQVCHLNARKILVVTTANEGTG
jgi:hypothetical protein